MSLFINQKKEEIREFRVAEISSILKRIIDDNFGFIRVIGEVSGLKIAASGHAYFNLKDNDSILACTCWKPIMSRLNFKLEDGMEIIAMGRLTTYAGQSRYQLSVEKIELNGSGALMELLLKRKEALAKEGLFDQERKKKIPSFPEKIGIITSPVGAVIEDILHRVRDRFPTRILLWPVAVQGENCAPEVTKAIRGFNRLLEKDRPDVIIVARGGGSIEDLWGFNEESVVRAVADSGIPVISAIGHETDFTLIDFVSDLRAPTPTAAAEFAVPVMSEIKAKLKRYESSCISYFSAYISRLELSLQIVSRSFATSQEFLFSKYQRLDDLSFRLRNSLPNNLKIKSTKLEFIKLPQTALAAFLDRKERDIKNLYEKTKFLMDTNIKTSCSKIDLYSRLLNSMNIRNILARGFAVVRSSSGKVLSSRDQSISEEVGSIEWHDGILELKNKNGK